MPYVDKDRFMYVKSAVLLLLEDRVEWTMDDIQSELPDMGLDVNNTTVLDTLRYLIRKRKVFKYMNKDKKSSYILTPAGAASAKSVLAKARKFDAWFQEAGYKI